MFHDEKKQLLGCFIEKKPKRSVEETSENDIKKVEKLPYAISCFRSFSGMFFFHSHEKSKYF